MSKIEEIMIKEGWLRTEYKNDGVVYIEFHKNGLIIDLDSIGDDLDWIEEKQNE